MVYIAGQAPVRQSLTPRFATVLSVWTKPASLRVFPAHPHLERREDSLERTVFCGKLPELGGLSSLSLDSK
jgi:hypothetical protein